jgi:hypothetical protein
MADKVQHPSNSEDSTPGKILTVRIQQGVLLSILVSGRKEHPVMNTYTRSPNSMERFP